MFNKWKARASMQMQLPFGVEAKAPNFDFPLCSE